MPNSVQMDKRLLPRVGEDFSTVLMSPLGRIPKYLRSRLDPINFMNGSDFLLMASG